MEDAKATMDIERTRLQAQVRDLERDALQLQQQLRFTQDELQKCHENKSQAQNEEKELQARLANEIEERERIQLQLHQVKKQVYIYIYIYKCYTRFFLFNSINARSFLIGCRSG